MPAQMVGHTLTHFRIVEKIGMGGMGVVYRAHDEQLDRDVAIKILTSGTFADETDRRHFRKEALVLSKVNHPNIETIHEFNTDAGIDFLVMEFIQGTTLNDKLNQRSLPEKEILKLGMQLADGLAAAHEHGILHRDLKPGNVRITPDGRVKILDFGLAKLTPQEIAKNDTTESLRDHDKAVGTLPYMSPEQLRNEKIDLRSDIYSTGAILYEMATGYRPITRLQIPALVEGILYEQPRTPTSLNSRISAELERIILKALDKDPDRRYQSARELRVDLERLATGSTTTSVRRLHSSRYFWRRFALPVSLIIFVALIGMIFGIQKRFNPWQKAGIPSEKHLAVLPFTSPGEDPSNQAYCDGLVETLTGKLTQLSSFHGSIWVVPMSEVRKEKVSSAKEAQQLFGVNLAVTGNLQRHGDRVQIVANLVDAKALRQLRSVSIETSIQDVDALQDGIVRQIAEMLEVDLQPQVSEVLEAGGTSLGRAYDYYLQGQGYLHRYDKAENLDAAIRSFHLALELDSQYALAYAGLAKAYWKKYDLTGDTQWVEPARKNAKHAVELDGQLVAARIALAAIQKGTGEFKQAIFEFAQALKTDPSSFEARLGLARSYEAIGELEKAELAYRGAIQFQPNVWYGYNSLGAFYLNSSRYPEAAEMFQQVIRLVPDSARGYSNFGAVYLEQGRYNKAISVLKKSINIHPNSDAYWNLGYVYMMLRRFTESVTAYEEAVRLREPQNFSIWGNLADAYYWSPSPSQREKALPAYQLAIELAKEELKVNPNSASALIMLALFQARVGNQNESLDSLHEAMRLKPDNAHFLFIGGLVYNRLGQTTAALDWLQRAMELGYPGAELNHIDLDNLRDQPRFRALTQKR
ncbi:protein kinase [bacterium]|nr:protein kinase [bacterium]